MDFAQPLWFLLLPLPLLWAALAWKRGAHGEAGAWLLRHPHLAGGSAVPPSPVLPLLLHTLACLLLVAALVSASAGPLDPGSRWNAAPSLVLVLIVPAVSVLLVATGLAMGARGAWTGFHKILRLSGRLPSDFMDTAGVPAGLFNMGLMGIASWLYVLAVGGPHNGPVLGGILTVVGFAAFGKHPRNTWPVLGGVAGATLLFGKGLASPGPLLAALFGTTLAPLAGEFGPIVGLLAGFIHLAMVERSGAWHLGVNLYNNGFAGGLTATFFVAVIEWYRSNRPGRRGPSTKPGDGGRGSP